MLDNVEFSVLGLILYHIKILIKNKNNKIW